MLNRRTFLKTVSAAVAVISVPVIPAIAKTVKSEPKWIRFSKATPKVGQKIIIASQVSVLGMICGGVVKKLSDSGMGSQYVALSTIDDFYVGYNGYPIGISYSEKGKEILSTRDWIREREFIAPRDYSERNILPHDGDYHKDSYLWLPVNGDYSERNILPHDGDYHKDSYLWLPVNGDYPKTIPPIPINPVYAELEKKPSELNTACANFGIRRRTSTKG